MSQPSNVCRMLALEPHIGTGEAADRLGVSRRTILRWVKSGKLRAYPLATNRNRVLVEDVDRLVTELRERAA